jgi:hypothetical protein
LQILTPVKVVPVPAAVWLFASGIIGLFSFRRASSKTITVINTLTHK